MLPRNYSCTCPGPFPSHLHRQEKWLLFSSIWRKRIFLRKNNFLLYKNQFSHLCSNDTLLSSQGSMKAYLYVLLNGKKKKDQNKNPVFTLSSRESSLFPNPFRRISHSKSPPIPLRSAFLISQRCGGHFKPWIEQSGLAWWLLSPALIALEMDLACVGGKLEMLSWWPELVSLMCILEYAFVHLSEGFRLEGGTFCVCSLLNTFSPALESLDHYPPTVWGDIAGRPKCPELHLIHSPLLKILGPVSYSFRILCLLVIM